MLFALAQNMCAARSAYGATSRLQLSAVSAINCANGPISRQLPSLSSKNHSLFNGPFDSQSNKKASTIGTGISSRNSEVIHAGLYYPTGSRRAYHCPRSRRMLYEFCESHGVPHRKSGKLVVATNDKEAAGIERIFKQSQINGCENVEMIARLYRPPAREAGERTQEVLERFGLVEAAPPGGHLLRRDAAAP